MKTVLNVFIELDTYNWLETVRFNLQRQRQKEVSMSETVDYVCTAHYTKKMRLLADQKHADRIGDRLKGSKVVKPKGQFSALKV